MNDGTVEVNEWDHDSPSARIEHPWRNGIRLGGNPRACAFELPGTLVTGRRAPPAPKPPAS